MGILEILWAVLLVMKLLGLIKISWGMVFLPLFISIVIYVLVYVVFYLQIRKDRW